MVYRDKILRVDLTNREITTEETNEKYLEKYVGGWGLGLRYLFDEIEPGIAPTDPENPLMFMTGPLTGIEIVPAATNCTVVTLNANTGFTAGRAHTHGWFGPYLKFAGYDGIIIEGKAEEPVYLWIDGAEDKLEIRDATHIWGTDSHDAEDMVKEDAGAEEASVAAIGQAGENQVFAAQIENDKNHHASHSGVGTVMGSKNLKAIGVFGDDDLEPVDQDLFDDVVKQWRGSLFNDDNTAASGMRHAGNYRELVKEFTEEEGLVTKNFQEKGWGEFGEGMPDQNITPKPCWGCPIACSYDVEVTEGPQEGYVGTMSGGVEGLEAGGSILRISEPGSVFRQTDLYDRYGLEASSIGTTLAVAFEAFERGKIDEEDTDGLVLEWGDQRAAEKLLEKTVNKEGIGEVLAKGTKRAAELLGVPDAAVHVKGAPINLHDWRIKWGVLIGQILGGGSGWPAPGISHRAEPSIGLEEEDHDYDGVGKARQQRLTGAKKFYDDSLGVCWFATWGVEDSVNLTHRAIEATTGSQPPDGPVTIGERILHLERVFNVQRGLAPRDDYEDIGPRLIEAIPSGKHEGVDIKPYLRGIIEDYYDEMDWDVQTGRPYKSTLEEYDIGQFADNIW